MEGIDDFGSSTLYLSAANQTPMGDRDPLPDALGCTMDNPMELAAASTFHETYRIGKAYPQAQYIYYCLYTEDGVIEPKRPFEAYAGSSPSIARIEKNLIPPLHNLDAVIRCISFVEDFSPCVWHQIFASIDSLSPIDDLNVWGMQHGCPGSLPERPLIFVRSADMEPRFKSSDKVTLYRPDGTTIETDTRNGGFPKTDGVVRREILPGLGERSVYRACTSAGTRGFVMAWDVSVYK